MYTEVLVYEIISKDGGTFETFVKQKIPSLDYIDLELLWASFKELAVPIGVSEGGFITDYSI